MKIFILCDGGLGNQLFQYAFGRALAIRSGGELVLDTWEIRRGRSRPLELGRFNIKAREATTAEMLRCRLADSKRFGWIGRSVRRVAPGIVPTLVRQKVHGYDAGIFEHRGTVLLDGWWQSELYFRDDREIILSELSFREAPSAENQAWLDRIRGCESVCVHVRRGDYVSDPVINKTIGVCGPDYYAAALELIRRRVPDATYFVFSDDPLWTRENLPVPEPREFVSHNCGVRNWEDLRLMSACRHFVIANSTFSWWGAWLGGSIGKIVIAPKRWFAAAEYSTKDIVPEDWIRV